MRTATRSTGPRTRSPQNTSAEIRPAPFTHRATHDPAAPKPHVTSELQCYIPVLIDNDCRSLPITPAKINRQPRRLEILVSRRKQTPAPPINRQHFSTSQITHHNSPITTHSLSNRHTSRLENTISHRKQTLGAVSNRHFLQVSGSHQRRIADAHRPPHVTTHIISNRQCKILEITKNPTKTHFSGVLIDTKTRYLHPGWGSGMRLENSQFHVQEFSGVFAEVGDQQAEVAAHSG